MSRARRPLHALGVVSIAVLVAGCGGGDAATTATPTPTPTPSTTPGAATVADPNAPAGTLDPVTGQPVDPAGVAGGGTATVPDLVGDDVSGGLAPITNNVPLFDAQAVEADELPEEKKPEDTTSTKPADTAPTTTAAVTYSGAKIYVDGIVHTVSKGDSFPKGNPVFTLLSVSANDIEISLVAGEFTASGGDGTFLDKGDLVSLVNASEQVTYRVKYLRPIADGSGVSF